MKINISDKALDWFVNEVGLSEGDGIHFFGKVYGKTNVHEGFSIGMEVKKPDEPEYELTLRNITFFVEHGDIWFFSGYNLNIDYDPELDGPKYTFIEE